MRPREHKVRVFVIDGRVRMCSLRVEQDQNVVLFGRRHKQADEIELSFAEVGSGFECLQRVLVLHGENEHGLDGVEISVRKDALEDRTHALELMSGAARLFFWSVADDAKV